MHLVYCYDEHYPLRLLRRETLSVLFVSELNNMFNLLPFFLCVCSSA